MGRTCSVGYIVNKSRAIILHLLVTDKYETSNAHLHMLVNIPLRFYDAAYGNIIGETRYTSHKTNRLIARLGSII